MSVEEKSMQKIWSFEKLEDKEIESVLPLEIKNFEKVLSATSNCYCKGIDKNDTKIKINLRIETNLVYLTKDGKVENITNATDTQVEYIQSTVGHVHVNIKNVQTRIDSFSETQVLANIKFEVYLDVLGEQSFTNYIPEQGEMFYESKELEIQKLETKAEGYFQVVEEFEYPSKKVLNVDMDVVLKQVTALSDCFLFDGEINLNILAEDEGILKNIFKKVAFSQEVSAIGSKAGLVAIGFLNPNSIKVVLSEDENNKKTATLSVELSGSGYGFSTEKIKFVYDVFSIKNEIIPSISGINIIKINSQKTTTKRHTETLSALEKNLNLGTILGVSDFSYTNKSLLATVLYRNPENDQIYSTLVATNLKDGTLSEYAQVSLIGYTKKKTKEIEVELEVSEISLDQNQEFETYISSVEIKEELDEENPAFNVVNAKKGDTIFSVAKKLKISPETIKEQNEKIKDVIEEDRKILVYKKK